MAKRYIKLSEDDIKFLNYRKKTSESNRVRDRSHALLLSNKGYDIQGLSEIFDVRQATVIDWFNRWESEGNNGLADRMKSGRPRIFTEDEEKK